MKSICFYITFINILISSFLLLEKSLFGESKDQIIHLDLKCSSYDACEVKTTNRGKNPLYFNNRFEIGSDIIFQARNIKTSVVLLPKHTYPSRNIAAQSFKLLWPNNTMNHIVSLKNLYYFIPKQKYEVFVQYENRHDYGRKIETWKGKVLSNKIIASP